MGKNQANLNFYSSCISCLLQKPKFLLNIHFHTLHSSKVLSIYKTCKFIFFLQIVINILNLSKSNAHLFISFSLPPSKWNNSFIDCNSINWVFTIHLLNLLDICNRTKINMILPLKKLKLFLYVCVWNTANHKALRRANN